MPIKTAQNLILWGCYIQELSQFQEKEEVGEDLSVCVLNHLP